MVTDLTDRNGGYICNTYLVGSLSLNHLLNTRKLCDTWRKNTPLNLNIPIIDLNQIYIAD